MKKLLFLFVSGIFVLAACKLGTSASDSAVPSTAKLRIQVNSSYTSWVGGSFTLTATVTPLSTGTVSYQWYEATDSQGNKPKKIDGATKNQYTASKNQAKKYYYYCVVTAAVGKNNHTTAKSNVVCVTVTANPPSKAQTPKVTVKEGDRSVNSNEKLTLSVEVNVTDGGKLSYQWYTTDNSTASGGKALAGETKNQIEITATETKRYYCQVTNTLEIGGGKAPLKSVGVSPLITVTVHQISQPAQKPSITAPTDEVAKTSVVGSAINLAVTAVSPDNGVLTYQWYQNTEKTTANAQKIAGATEAVYQAQSTTATIHYFYCAVTNTKSGTSETVYTPFYSVTFTQDKQPAAQPVITTQPPAELTLETKENKTITIGAEIPDGGTLSYAWYQSATGTDGGTLLANTAPTYTIPTETAGTQYYRCKVTNTNPDALSEKQTAEIYTDWCKVTVKEEDSLSKFTVAAVGNTMVTIGVGETASLQVTVNNAPPDVTTGYKWLKGTPPAEDAASPDMAAEGDGSKAVYTTASTLTAGTYTYYCEVTLQKTVDSTVKTKKKYSPQYTVQVVEPAAPVITQQPKGGAAALDSGVPLNITATVNTGNLVYQWYKNTKKETAGSIALDNATTAVYTAKDEGTFYYYCEVSNSKKTDLKVTSEIVTVMVYRDSSIIPVDMNGETDGLGWVAQQWVLGSSKETDGITFAVYSEHAERVMLELYDNPNGTSNGEAEKAAFFMEKSTDNIWRAKIKTTASKVYYGFRVWGANWPYTAEWKRGDSNAGFVKDVDDAGNRFNPNKLLSDPYSLELSHTRGSNGSYYQTGETDRTKDSGKVAPKSVVVEKLTGIDTQSTSSALTSEIVYQLHIKGFTGNGVSNVENCTVLEEEKGTYTGTAKMIPYLKGLGINTVLLLPVFESEGMEDYRPANFFAVAKKYAKDKENAAKEFQDMVKKFHDENMQVFLDVPYANSGEDGKLDNDVNKVRLESLRGLDNTAYYALTSGNKADYWVSTGNGNNLNCSSKPAKDLILASVKYWTETMGIDGFRFNAGVALGREGEQWQFNKDAALLSEIKTYLIGKNRKCIIETKDNNLADADFGDGWTPWNNTFRDAARHYLNNKEPAVKVTNMLDKAGVLNFMAAHDSYRLTDMVSHGNNQSEVSTDSGDNGNIHTSQEELRRIRVRNALVLTAFAKGSPMLTYGDEFGVAHGNTCSLYTNDVNGVFFSDYGYISRDAICTELGSDCHTDNKNGLYLFAKTLFDWRSKNAAFFKDAQYTVTKDTGDTLGNDDTKSRVLLKTDNAQYCVCINMSNEMATFTLPKAQNEKWACCIDTAKWAESNTNAEDNLYKDRTKEYNQSTYGVNGYSIAVFKVLP